MSEKLRIEGVPQSKPLEGIQGTEPDFPRVMQVMVAFELEMRALQKIDHSVVEMFDGAPYLFIHGSPDVEYHLTTSVSDHPMFSVNRHDWALDDGRRDAGDDWDGNLILLPTDSPVVQGLKNVNLDVALDWVRARLMHEPT